MKILVCVKQVYDSPETLVFDESTGQVTFGPHTVFRMNRYDEYALEEALRIRERLGGAVIDAISVGPARAAKTIRRAMELGADHGIHVQTGDIDSPGAFERAHLIAAAARGRGYDLVLAGVMAEDDMESQVGPLLAAVLEYGCATGVIFEEISGNGREIAVEREVEGGSRECLTLALPCVLTIQSGINTPRYPALSHVLRARSSELECIAASSLAVPPPAQSLVRILPPAQGRKGEIIEGTAVEKADKLIHILREHSLLPRQGA
ncbi:MAG: electron transfer flavoprotein subunit beta/FixA family protein [Desulfomonilia bacterium]|jgi:electron transfer flavoprotein beta subunit|nr:electron transfer flavoprotein subunit beta/FixA family protein [Deltaproteobacteria bacterium]HPX17659.1 electron transfer flavoprotein subunit beta/FixA family protein [Deltaproteobacteria bacterium]HRS56657.1 electron transfer flavoprotein subunit beta/FixA family protein [Desulfomonilia bacterium]HRV34992.1 electron transfer flavoprotein subunit beta/FixA family protein [Desulfomonilia bacterium]